MFIIYLFKNRSNHKYEERKKNSDSDTVKCDSKKNKK